MKERYLSKTPFRTFVSITNVTFLHGHVFEILSKVCFMNNLKNIQEMTGHDEEAMLRLSRGMCIHEV